MDDEIGCAGFMIGAALVWIAVWWFQDRDDARLDHLRDVTVEQCGERTEGVAELRKCVRDTLGATGQST